MKLKHIILRTFQAATRDSFTGPSFRAAESLAPAAGASIELAELSDGDVATVTRDRDVVAVAPVMPMKLIKPFNGQNASAAGGTAWGVKAVGAETSPFSGMGVVVAVLDTGIDPAHPAFQGVTLKRKNFTAEGDDDKHGHGTHCAGTIFGQTVQGTRIGVAPGVKTALIGKVLGAGGGSSDRIADAIQWAVENGANVISMSLGIDFPGYVRELEAQGIQTQPATSQALEGYRANVQLFERLAAMIRAQGAFGRSAMLIAAAGNESQRPNYEISVSPPAVANGVLSVAAVGYSPGGLVVAPFSNTGANISGPGVDVLSARAGGGLVSMSGTSMATPHVAGVAALWAEKIMKLKPLNNSEWEARLIASATYAGFAPNFDPSDMGAGLVSAPQA